MTQILLWLSEFRLLLYKPVFAHRGVDCTLLIIDVIANVYYTSSGICNEICSLARPHERGVRYLCFSHTASQISWCVCSITQCSIAKLNFTCSSVGLLQYLK